MSNENVVVMFTDIVNSTAMDQLLSPAAADRRRREHFDVLRRALSDCGGTEVKSLGDGLMAVFARPSAAIACAVAMQQAVERSNHAVPVPMAVRIGISGGEVTCDEGDYYGDPVVEAARLCAAGDGGRILAADVVRVTAGRNNPSQCRPLGPMALKGLDQLVETVEVVWEPLPSVLPSGVPLPPRLLFRPSVGVVCRDSETSAIGDALKRVDAGGGREILLVSGEAGLGKTTLVAEAARRAFDAGTCVLFGHCEEEVAVPYQLFSEALSHYVENAVDDQLRAHVDRHGSELGRLVPGLARRVPGLPPSRATDTDTERYLLFAAAVGLLASASSHTAVLLVLDDLQWADSGSLQLLRHVAASDQTMRLLVLGTYRDSELSQSHALRETLGRLRRHPGVSRIELGGLDDSGVVTFMEAAAGHELDQAGIELAQAVHRETDGNPFFVAEVLRHLSETGGIFRDSSGHWTTREPLDQLTLPDSVRAVIGGRVARLGTNAEAVLATAAVIGKDFDLALLTRVVDVDEDELIEILESARAAALVRELEAPPDHFTFSHALIQHTIYEDLGKTRRSRTHRRVALALEDLCGGRTEARIGELARHWINATQPSDLARAVAYSNRAGNVALDALAPAEALRHFSQAIELSAPLEEPDRALALDLAIGLGTSQRQTGDPAFRDTLLGAARQALAIGDARRLVAAVLANNRGFYSSVGALDTDRVAMLEAALDALEPDDQDRALVLATLCSELAHGSSLEGRQALADEAIALAKSSRDTSSVVRVLNHVYVPLQVPHLLQDALDRTTEAMVLAEELGDPAQLHWAAMWRAETAARAGQIDELDHCLDIQGQIARQLDEPIFKWAHTFVSAMRALLAGDTGAGEALANEALRMGSESGQPDAAVIYGAQLMIVCGQRGTMSGLIPLIEDMKTGAPDISPWLFGSLLAKANVEAGRTDEAHLLLQEFAAAGYDLPLDQIWLTGMVDYADAAIACGDPALAGPLFERLLPLADQLPATGASALPPVSFYLGGLAAVLGRFDEAEAHFERAAEFSERIGGRFFSARTGCSWGQMLLRRDGPGDRQRASDLLVAARRSAAEQGYRFVERSAAEALSQLAG